MRIVILVFAFCALLAFEISPANAYGANQGSGAIAFTKELQTAVKNKNTHFVGKHLVYPIHIYVIGTKMLVGGAGTAEDAYEDWMTPYLYNLITKTPPGRLVKLLKIRKGKNGHYKVHRLLFTGDPADFRYSKDGIYSAKDLLHVIGVLRKGAEEHCAQCVAEVIEYPIWDCIHGKLVKIRNAAEFVKDYDRIVTPEVKALMLHAWEQHNWSGFPEKGIMLGVSGDIWIGSFGHKNAQGFYVWETKVLQLREVGSCPAQ